MDKKQLNDLNVPEDLLDTMNSFNSEDGLLIWENKILEFFSSQYAMFTQYPQYFQLRTYEFRILKQLLPQYFDVTHKYETILEIGCNFGYKSMLLSPYANKLIAVDIPEEYHGCILGDFKWTTDIAKVLVNKKFGIRHVVFENRWPYDLKHDDNSVDMIFTEYVLEHIPDLHQAIKEMHRVLRKGGVMLHTVPNTKDAIMPFLEANTNITWKKMFSIMKSNIGGWLKKKIRNDPKLKCNGTIVPPCHSEFTTNFLKQIEIYTLENYLFPMLAVGLKVEKILSTREHNYVLVVRKI